MRSKGYADPTKIRPQYFDSEKIMKIITKFASLQFAIGAALIFAHMTSCFAEVAMHCTDSCYIQITGTITSQDANTVAKIPAQLPKRQKVFVNLNSPGGDVDAAMAIGRVLRSLKAGAKIGMNQECSSACVLLLASGVTRFVALGRTDDEKGRIGIHRLFLMSTSEKDYDSVQRKYKQMESKIRAYLKEMNVPESLYDAMMQIPSERPRYLSVSELTEYSLNVSDPVYADLVNSMFAEKYGLTKIEYLKRLSRTQQECKIDYADGGDQTIFRAMECEKAIFKGLR